MFDPANVQARLKAAFDSFTRHSDYVMVRSQVAQVVDVFPTLPTNQRIMMGTLIAGDFMHTLANDEPVAVPNKRLPLTREEKVGIYLEVAQSHPELLDRFRLGFRTINLSHQFSEAVGVPALPTLMKYPQIDEGVGVYVATYLNKYAYALPYLGQQLEGTTYNALITPPIIAKYRDSFANHSHTHIARDWAVLKTQKQTWEDFVQASPDLKVFGAYAPAIKAEEVCPFGSNYLIDYDAKNHVMTIDFTKNDKNFPTSLWIRLVPKSDLHATYTLLSHALEVLKDQREGALSKDQKWRTNQLKVLKPILEKDIADLGQEIVAQKMRIPSYTPRAVMPTNP